MRPEAVSADRLADVIADRPTHLAAERAIDEVLAESFPASDPPSWNQGMARPAGEVSAVRLVEARAADRSHAKTSRSGTIDVPGRTNHERTVVQGLISLAGATGIALLVPVAILVVGSPVALAVRGLVEIISWLIAVAFS